MNLRLRIASIGIACLACATVAYAARAQGFRQVTSADGVDVWAVGDAGAVFRSLDGGLTWGSDPLGTATHRGVAARGARVWIVDDDGTLWTSVDHGYTFTTRQPAVGVALHAIAFANDAVGWIAGAGGLILATDDAGDTWHDQPSGSTADLLAVRARSASEAWACGTAGTVLHTTDGGASWSASNPLGTTRDLLDIDGNGTDLYVAGGHAFVARSLDEGASWTAMDLGIKSRSDVNALALLPPGSLWLAGGGGFMRRTQDHGAVYFYPEHPIVTGISDVFFLGETGWACAAGSKLVARTTDGGLTWTVPGGGGYGCAWALKISNEGQTIRGNTLVVDPVDRDKLYAVQGRTVYASGDRGETWQPVSTIPGAGSKTNAFLVSPSDPLKWLALTQSGDRISRTTDGGASWASVLEIAYTEYGLPMEQDPDDPDVVYFAPEDGKLWKSDDFGATWFEHSNPGFRSPDDIAMVRGTDVVYVADGVTGSGSGQIWKSDDRGLTWALKRTVSGSEIPMIAVSELDRMIAYATCWASGGVLRSTDQGDSWLDNRPTPSEWSADIAKDDPNVALTAVYSGGAAFITLDRGQSWTQSTVPGSNYGAMAYDRGTYFLHQSNGIYKAVITQPDMPASNAQSLVLGAPAGGEAWAYGASEAITWAAVNVADVSIQFRPDALSSWQTIASPVSGPSGSFAWQIPDVPTHDAMVRVSDANDGDPYDESEAPFSILVPTIAPSRASLDFGGVPIGGARAETLSIANQGTATLVVASVSLAGGGPFTPTRTSFSVAPGGAETLAVIFEPNALQAYDDTLLIACNAPASPRAVPLHGSGTGGVDAPAVAGAPSRFELRQAVPNPFGGAGTVIRYALARESDVRLEVYNVLGQSVATLVRARQGPGLYAVRFPGAAWTASGLAATLPSGVYFCRIKAGGFSASRRMILVR